MHQRFFRYFSEGKYLTQEYINIDSYFHQEKEVRENFRQTQLYYIQYIDSAKHDLPYI